MAGCAVQATANTQSLPGDLPQDEEDHYYAYDQQDRRHPLYARPRACKRAGAMHRHLPTPGAACNGPLRGGQVYLMEIGSRSSQGSDSAGERSVMSMFEGVITGGEQHFLGPFSGPPPQLDVTRLWGGITPRPLKLHRKTKSCLKLCSPGTAAAEEGSEPP
jgi:hypothetical protein